MCVCVIFFFFLEGGVVFGLREIGAFESNLQGFDRVLTC